MACKLACMCRHLPTAETACAAALCAACPAILRYEGYMIVAALLLALVGPLVLTARLLLTTSCVFGHGRVYVCCVLCGGCVVLCKCEGLSLQY